MSKNFNKVLSNAKFLFEWKKNVYDLEISQIFVDRLIFSKPLALPLLEVPIISISIKLGKVWHEHVFKQADWIIKDGEGIGFSLFGSENELNEYKMNLELALCV